MTLELNQVFLLGDKNKKRKPIKKQHEQKIVGINGEASIIHSKYY